MTPHGAARVSGPRIDLSAFQAEVQAGNFHVYKTRALNVICRVRNCALRQARAYAQQAVLSLQRTDYAHTLQMPNGQVQDVYGKLIDADGWYLKIEIHMHDAQPGIVSCHPAEHDLATVSGMVPRSRKRFG